MSASLVRGPTWLALSEDSQGPAIPAPWIGPLLALGTRASRYVEHLGGRQLVVAISVPRRDFAAALVGCGWMMARPAPRLGPPLSTMRGLARGTPVRVVTERHVLTDCFFELNEVREPARLHLATSRWHANKIKAIATIDHLEIPQRQDRPTPGGLGALARLDESWDDRLCRPPQDLAIVGTLAWFQTDLEAYISRAGDPVQARAKLSSFILPTDKHAATWSTRLYAAAKFADKVPLAKEIRAVVLDGLGAARYLAEIEAPLVVVILDRSIADETASEIVVQLRNTRGEPVALDGGIGWRPPAGIEALAFSVPL